MRFYISEYCWKFSNSSVVDFVEFTEKPQLISVYTEIDLQYSETNGNFFLKRFEYQNSKKISDNGSIDSRKLKNWYIDYNNKKNTILKK